MRNRQSRPTVDTNDHARTWANACSRSRIAPGRPLHGLPWPFPSAFEGAALEKDPTAFGRFIAWELPCTTEPRDRVTRERCPRRRRFFGTSPAVSFGCSREAAFTDAESNMVREGPAQPAPPPKEPYPAEKARGGEIVLRRWVFLGGLAGVIALVLLLSLVRWAA
jgi:hypothetical protein